VRSLDASLYTVLNGASTLIALGVTGVHKSVGPEGATLPYVIFDQAAAPISWTLSTFAYTDYFYNVRAVTEGYAGEEKAKQIAEAIQVVLNDSTAVTASPRTVSSIRATQEMSYSERSGNQVFYHAGAQYRIEVV